MRCEEFIEMLDREGAAITAEAAAHAETCPACGPALERWSAARRQLRALADEPAPPFLAARVMAAVRAEGAGRQRPAAEAARWRQWLAPALALLVVASLGGWELWQALRGGGAPVQEARVAAAASDTGRRDAPRPELADRDASLPAVAPQAAATTPAAPAAPRRRPATMAERNEQAAAVPAQAPGFAPEPLSAPVEEGEARLEQPGVAGGAVGGVLAAAPAAARGDAPAAATAVAESDRRLGKHAAVSFDEMKANSGAAVTVRLTAASGAAVLAGAVDAGAAPAQGTWWRVQVADDGAIHLADSGGRDIGAEHPDTVAFLHARRLSPGVYRLSR